MDNSHLGFEHDENNSEYKPKGNKEHLEISSTGYGLESVSTEDKVGDSIKEENHSNPSCGGL